MLKPPLQPMLLTDLEKPFNSDDFIFEIKWDGYRSLVFTENKDVYLQSRNQKDLTPYFPELKKVYQQVNSKRAILDGEICYLNEEGKPVFEFLQGRIWKKYDKKEKIKYPVSLVIWDLLAFENEDIYKLPLIERKKYLKEIVRPDKNLYLSPYIKREGKQLYKSAAAEGLEGIIAKKIDSPYEFKRSKYWYKIKIWQYTEAFVAGYRLDRTGLVVGRFKDNNFIYMGKIKLALSKEEEEVLFRFLPSIKIEKSPFQKEPQISNVNWVKPSIKCRVKFTEITGNETFRHGYVIKLLV